MVAQNHFDEIFSALLTFREEGLLCDTVIVTRNKELLAHGVLLAAASPVFRSAFQDSEKTGLHYINLPDVESVIIEIALHFIYTGKLLLPDVYTQTNELPKLFAALHLLGLEPQKLNGCEMRFKSSEGGSTARKQTVDVSRTLGESAICNQLKSYNVTIEEAPDDSSEKNDEAASPDSFSPVSEPLEIEVVAELVKNGLLNANQLQPFMPTPVSGTLDEDRPDVVRVKEAPIQRSKRGRPIVKKNREIYSTSNAVAASKRRPLFRASKAAAPDVWRNAEVAERKPMVSLLTGVKYDDDGLKVEVDQEEVGSNNKTACLVEPNRIKEEVTAGSDQTEVRSAAGPTKPTSLVLVPVKKSSEGDDAAAQRTRTKGPRKQMCPICSKPCKTRSRLDQHLLTHTGQKPHVCPYCTKGFTNKSNLDRHVKMHTGVRPHLCDLCGKGFIQKTSLLDHMIIHYEAKAYKCTMCELSYNRKANLRQHVKRMHQPKSDRDDPDGLPGFDHRRPFLCDLCGHGFSTLVTLRFHKKLHAGDKPYVCGMCEKGFVQKAQLDQHFRIHTGDKPYVCQTCGKAFIYKDSLTQHTRIHTGEKPYVCKVCSKSYTQSHHLKGHMLTHTGEKPYGCQLCSKAYKNRADLRFHSSRVHQVNIPKFTRKQFL